MKNILKGIPWKRLFRIGKPFWVSEKRNVALAHLLTVIALLAANALVVVFINVTAGHFMTAIEQRDTAAFYHYLWVYAASLLVATPIQVFYGYYRTRLALVWRSWLSTSLFARYYANRAYYRMIADKELDNPDQRMTQDVDSFCNSSVGLFIVMLDALVNVTMNVGVLWAISHTLTFTVIGYAALGSVVVILIGKALVRLNFMNMKTEADLRFSLTETRREAEAIAFYRGEPVANQHARSKLKKVIDTLMDIMRVNRNIQLFTTAYNLLVPLIPAAIIAPLYFHGQIPFGTITQATMAFTIVFNGATVFIGQFAGISAYAAIINRVGSFIESLDKTDAPPVGPHIDMSEGEDIYFQNVSIVTPDKARVLIKDLTLDVRGGSSVLVIGPDGSGKTTIMRTLAGLWDGGSGTLVRPPSASMMFLTQNPYLPPMTLREALSYPCATACPDDDRLTKILDLVNLHDLLERASGFDTEQNWRELLSLSEQQRLGLGRLIQAKPKYAIIDEATSGLEEENEKLLYTLLTSLGTTIFSAGGSNLLRYHSQVLELDGKGGWKVYPASQAKPDDQPPAQTVGQTAEAGSAQVAGQAVALDASPAPAPEEINSGSAAAHAQAESLKQKARQVGELPRCRKEGRDEH